MFYNNNPTDQGDETEVLEREGLERGAFAWARENITFLVSGLTSLKYYEENFRKCTFSTTWAF
jgi:hypothetical protein